MTIPPYQHGIPDGEDDWEEETLPVPGPVERARDACYWAVAIVACLGFLGWLLSLVLGGER